MHFLYGYTAQQRPVIVHAIGFSDEDGSGFYNNEPIYEVEKIPNPERPDVIRMQVKKQIGVVKSEDGNLRFEYTDPDFKRLINYNESTGHSTLDGGLLVNSKTHEQFMYVSARNPIGVNVGALQASLFGTQRTGNLSASAEPAAPAQSGPRNPGQ